MPEFFSWLAKLFPRLKFLPFAAVIILGVLLWSDDLRTALQLNKPEFSVGVAFVVALIITLAQGIGEIWNFLTTWKQSQNVLKIRQDRLRHLTPDEKKILRGFIENDARTRNLDCGSGVNAGLVHDGILYRADATKVNYMPADRWPYNIEEFAWKFLHDHPELVGLIPGTPRPKTGDG